MDTPRQSPEPDDEPPREDFADIEREQAERYTDIHESASEDVAFPPTPDHLAELPHQDEPGPQGQTYHHYSTEERQQLANQRFQLLMGTHAKVEGMLTFLAFGTPAGLAQIASVDGHQQLGILDTIRDDVNDVALAVNELVKAYAGVLNEIAREALDTADYLAWKKGQSNGDPQG